MRQAGLPPPAGRLHPAFLRRGPRVTGPDFSTSPGRAGVLAADPLLKDFPGPSITPVPSQTLGIYYEPELRQWALYLSV